MQNQHLMNYPPVNVIDPKLEEVFTRAIEQESKDSQKGKARQIVRIFRVYLDLSGRFLKVIGFEQTFPILIDQFYGFLQTNYGLVAYSFANPFQRIAELVCEEMGGEPIQRKEFKLRSISTDMQQCLIEFNKVKLNPERVDYYNGWMASCADRGERFWNLSFFQNHYGAVLTKQIWSTVERFSNTTNYNTSSAYHSCLTGLIKSIIELYPSKAELIEAGSYLRINETVRTIFFRQLIDARVNGRVLPTFYNKTWPKTITVIEKFFIGSGVWCEPTEPLWCPRFKVSSTVSGTNKVYDEQGNAFSKKLVTHIPLSYSDDQTIQALLESIECDISHVSKTCRQLTLRIMKRFAKRKELAVRGDVKPLYKHGGILMDSSCVDMYLDANQCATFEYYQYDFEKHGYFLTFASFMKAKRGGFSQKYALPTSYLLYPFLFLIVEQHPEITESWFIDFKLYDKNGKLIGLRQSGSSWVAVSTKKRRGSVNAQQVVVLNEVSKALFDDIISLTEQARTYLKEKGDDDYRSLLLTSTTGLSKPSRMTRISAINNKSLQHSEIKKELLQPSEEMVTDKAEGIVRNLTLATFRASCGVQVYLKTKSVKEMSDALGHASYNPSLLSHYLPEPILLYFQSRWVRLFQNALIYEAMSDSDYLIEALDFGEGELVDFLKKHKLNPLPEHIMTGHISDLTTTPVEVEYSTATATILVTTHLLRVMLCLINLVEAATDRQIITQTAAKWYEASKFVIKSIETVYTCPKVKRALSDALSNPLPITKLKGAVYEA